jgi:hypothetical protein
VNDGLPIWVYFLAPLVVISALVLGLWLLPAIVFAAATIRSAIKIESTFWALSYAVFLGLLCIASFAWPVLVVYGVSELVG